jgi:hypothetical protein
VNIYLRRSRRIVCGLMAILGLGMAVATPAVATAKGQPQRVALVIGVSEYNAVPRLANPARDAEAIARRLRRFGFQVEEHSSGRMSRNEFDQALVRLRQRAKAADAVVVFFAGHGIELQGQNFLLPSDALLADERDVQREAVQLDHVLAEVRSERPERLNLVILDACRENPFRHRLAASGRSVSRGLGRPAVLGNSTMIAFATAANDVAADGTGKAHSPYTHALLDVMDREPGLEIGIFFRRVRAQVMRQAPSQQPWEHGALLGEFYWQPQPGQVPVVRQEPSTAITEADLRRAYDALVAAQPVEYRARHILVDTESEAVSLIDQIRGGASFERLAQTHSKDRDSALAGGDLDFAFPESYVPEFGNSMKRLRVGQMTDRPVKSQFGWHVIRLEDTRRPPQPAYDAVRNSLREQLELRLRQSQSLPR